MIKSIEDLTDFLKQFHRSWLVAPELAEHELSMDLPPGLRSIYRELGALVEIGSQAGTVYRPPFGAQDRLLPHSRLKRVDGMLEFAWENQGNWSARCFAGQNDPPVYSNARDVWTTDNLGFAQVCDSLNHFLTTLCLQEAVMSCRFLVTIDASHPIDDVLNSVAEGGDQMNRST
jgi:hypothetical protein